MKRIALSILCIAAGILGLVSLASAQMTPTIGNDVSISMIPENPGPNQQVTITITSYSIDTQSANIEWSVDAGPLKGGIGHDSFTFTTGNAGDTTTIGIDITPVGDVPIEKTIVITPETADLLWETTDAIVPPFYRGKAMPTSESTLKFVAIPGIKSSGAFSAPSTLVYNWQENTDSNQAASGYGKDSYTTSMDYLNPNKDVAVDVTSLDGSVTASAETTVTPSSPELIMYASSPLYGPLFNNALSGTYAVSGNETSLYAEPYFFTVSDPDIETVTYAWQLNGSAITTPDPPNALLLERSDKSTGDATVDLTVTNVTKLFEQLSAHLDLSLQ